MRINIDPVACSLGPLKIHWYGLCYLLAFGLAWVLANYRIKQMRWSQALLADFIFYAALGAILGGRIGYLVIYGLDLIKADPWFIFKLWQGGMSFHGGLIGVIIALWSLAKKNKLALWQVLDFAAPLAPLGLALGRIGNFINGEVFGRTTDLPWGVVFFQAGAQPRHPSQLYEALIEGVLLFILLWSYTKQIRAPGKASGLFLLGYGLGRCFCEFFRVPDVQLGFILFDWLTMGQLLSLPMIITGIWLLWFRRCATDISSSP